MISPERLNRFLARRGVTSRRGADSLIAAGRVVVNGRRAALGTVIAESDRVEVDGHAIGSAPATITLMLNKPIGVVTTVRDPGGRPTVIDLVDRHPGLVPVGRLDADSRGLLLLSTDGELLHRLTHPRHGVPKRYRVTIHREFTDQDVAGLLGGIDLADGPARALTARPVPGRRTALDIELGEGRKREIRRLCAALGLDVVDLQRIGLGPLWLGDLAEGAYRALEPEETRALYSTAQLPQP